MKISWNYLQSFFSQPLAQDVVLERLTMAGLEVESVTPLAPAFSGIVVGEVLECVKHPEADKLSLCKVDAGSGELLQILCGASNVKAGVKVPCAIIGAVLPGDFKITQRKMRGLNSYGMLCSSQELGQDYAVDDGLLLLPDDAPVGCDIRDYLELNDSIIEFKITPNRGDCLSYRGLVREIAALTNSPAKDFSNYPESALEFNCNPEFTLKVLAPSECPHYVGLKMHQVNNNLPSPAWLVKILERSAIRSISPLVDISNYVLLYYGQPMHVFDLNAVAHGIQVRLAKDGEQLKLIDGSQAILTADTLLIANSENQPLAIAGVMGGLASAVTNQTSSIVLESAYFNPLIIAGKAKQYGISSDAAFRYERGVDRQIQHDAINLAAKLVTEICGGVAGAAIHYRNPEPEIRQPIELSFNEIDQFIGQKIPESQIVKIIHDLGCQFSLSEPGLLKVTPPSYRFDLAIKPDIIEEIIRVYGYDNIQAQMPKLSYSMNNIDGRITRLNQFKQILISNGFNEIISYAFIEKKYADLFANPAHAQVKLQNPIAGLAVLRNNLVSDLIKTLQHNVNRGHDSLKIFELARVFHGEDPSLQPLYLGALIYGKYSQLSWAAKPRAVDFYDLKLVLEQLVQNYGTASFSASQDHACCHPGRTALLHINGVEVGFIGQLHPRFAQELSLEELPYICELNLELLQAAAPLTVTPPSKFQKVSRDLAWVFANTVAVAEVKAAIAELAIPELRSVCEFDVFYALKSVDSLPGKQKSVAFNFIFQADKTLNDEEINLKLDQIKALVAKQFAAELRV